MGKLSFYIVNTGTSTINDIDPLVRPVKKNKKIQISPMTTIFLLAPGESVKYTVTIMANRQAKNENIDLLISLTTGTNEHVLMSTYRICTSDRMDKQVIQ